MAVPKLSAELRGAIKSEAMRLAVSPAALAAIVAVESGGRLSARVAGRDEPLIRFEGHYFDRRLAGRSRAIAREAGLAHPDAGAIRNPASQPARWAMLRRAASIHHAAAYESCSWGCGQVMGAHWRWLGYDSVDDLVAEARSNVGGQVKLMSRFIERSGLAASLRDGDFEAFARGYNGPGFAANRYDAKLAAANKEYDLVFAGEATAGQPPVLRRGSMGPSVRDLQSSLQRLGHVLEADGVFGPRTEDAVKVEQARMGVAADGVVGALTREALQAVLSHAGRPANPAGKKKPELTVFRAILTLTYALLQRVFAHTRLD